MAKPYPQRGPFRVDQLQEGDRYELEDGNPVYCAPAGAHHGKASARGIRVMGADPNVEEIGIDVGYASGSRDLRAPDISIGNVPDAHGWASGAPRLAIEYAGTGQDEDSLTRKVNELLERGTEQVWVARLMGPRRVEVHQPGRKMKVMPSGERLQAPGILRNPVEVDALYDDEASLEANLRALLQREGYDSIEEIKEEGRAEGRAQGRAEGRAQGRAEGRAQGRAEGMRSTLLRLLEQRFGPLDDASRAKIMAAEEPTLESWIDRVFDAAHLEAALE